MKNKVTKAPKVGKSSTRAKKKPGVSLSKRKLLLMAAKGALALGALGVGVSDAGAQGGRPHCRRT